VPGATASPGAVGQSCGRQARTGGSRHASIALRVAGRTSVHLIDEAVLHSEFEGLALPGHRVAVFPPILPRVPPAAKLPLWRDVPPADIVCCAAVRPFG